MRPSKIAEMKAEVEGQGFVFIEDEHGWNALIGPDCLLDAATPTLEACVMVCFGKIFDQKGRAKKRLIDIETGKATVKL